MPFAKSDTPGLKRRVRNNGAIHFYWRPGRKAVKAGYKPISVRLSYSDEVGQRHLIVAACQRLEAEKNAWLAGIRERRVTFNGTIADLVSRFERDDASPFQKARHTTRKKDTYTLRLIAKAFGQRSLASLKFHDIHRWYDEARKPKVEGGPERIRKAVGIIAMLRRIIAYGVMAELPECLRLRAILKEARFAHAPRRRVRLEAAHLQALCPRALEMGRLSIALSTAIQFETTLRQKDVIGEWIPMAQGDDQSGLVLNGRRWEKGLVWSDILPDFEVRKATTKTGAVVAHDLKLCPMTYDLLQRIPPEKRVGPLIVDEKAGRPYAESAFGREWRVIARAAGVPDEVRNMDARAGGVSEADEAGAPTDLIRAQTGHTLSSTTERYKRGGNMEGSRAVARLRNAHRAAANGH